MRVLAMVVGWIFGGFSYQVMSKDTDLGYKLGYNIKAASFRLDHQYSF